MPSSKSIAPSVSVVVCHHTGDLLQRFFLPSIFKSVGVTFEVIVITSDEKVATEGLDGCLVIHHTGLPAEKRNIGARLARAKYVAFFDDDVEVAEDTLAELLNGFGLSENVAGSSVGMVYGKLWNMEHRDRFDEAGSFLTKTGFLWSRAGQNDVDTGQYDKEEYVLAGKSASCMVNKAIFEKVGGFDEDFGILGEETDLSWRILLAGKYVLYEPLAVGWHAFNTKFKPPTKHYTSSRVQRNGCRNYLTMLTKNLGKEHLWIIPIHASIWFIAGLAMIITLRIRQGANILRGLLDWAMKSGETLKKRTRIQSTRKLDEPTVWPIIFRTPPRGYYTQRFFRYLITTLHG